MFIWNATDENGDNMTYDINITCHPACSQDNRMIWNWSYGMNYTNSTHPFQYLWDDNYYYEWSVRAFDNLTYSEWTPVWNFSIQSLVMVTLNPDTVAFATAFPGDSNHTEDNSPPPFLLSNDGNVEINITFTADNYLWDSVSSPSTYYQVKTGINTLETQSFNESESVMTWSNINLLDLDLISYLGWQVSNNTAEIDINITVPPAEPPGAKSVTFNITGEVASEGGPQR